MRAPDLYPIPLSALVERLDRELAAGGDVYHLPRRAWWTPDPARDTSLLHFGHRLATPAGPASGPHTQLAQNLVLAWLAGGRFLELKTVQVRDDLEIPRPCIHVPHVGYNVEWSQELRVAQSAEEYAKGWLLVHMLASDRGPGLWPGVDAVFDTSVGYDLAGLRSQKVRDYLDTLRDASSLLDRLRGELVPSLSGWGEAPCPSRISDTLTISTFHGCPANEIEAIARQTLEWGWHTVIKLNPTLLGYGRTRGLLDAMRYDFIELHQGDFDKDLHWNQLCDFVPRLAALAADRGLGFGVKFSNTLVCSSPEPPFAQEEMYFSGPPLHVLAFTLAAAFRDTFPDVPITFSAGIDAKNFAEVVRAGIGPVTSCTDLLKARGYGRLSAYVRGLERAMAQAEAPDLAHFIDPATLPARAATLAAEPRYQRAKNATPPRKVGSHLVLLDCLTCDKCIPVCPNGANFSLEVPTGEHQPGRITWHRGAFTLSDGERLLIAQRHQIANTADACNLCGHCDTWCPEDGGPYLVKPTVFLSPEAFEAHPERDGFLVSDDGTALRWRRGSDHFAFEREAAGDRLRTDTGAVLLQGDTPIATEGHGEVDLTVATTLRLFLDALNDPATERWRA